jgi:NIMA (never in mitosis gene a)-related kinase 1/4/5
VWRVLIETVHALRQMHALNIMHRDIKSANIFLCKAQPSESSQLSLQEEQGSMLYQAKLGDMNVSKVTTKGMNSTQTGTPYYASPEVWRDEPYSFKSDIWSLGCVIYEMLALKPPF